MQWGTFGVMREVSVSDKKLDRNEMIIIDRKRNHIYYVLVYEINHDISV